MSRENQCIGRFSQYEFLILFIISFCSDAQKFIDVTEQAGINHQFVVYEGFFGGGACIFDFNNDGFEDVFITSGMNEDVLYLNNGDGSFKNIYQDSGLEISSHFITQGAAAADVNKDGWIDLFITTINTKDSIKRIPRAQNLLFLNNGNSTFRYASVEFKMDQLMSFSTGVCFGDFDLDGYPDVYVGNYFRSYEGKLSEVNDETIVNSTQTTEGYLLRNVSGKYFNNMYSDYKLSYKGFGFGAVFTDFDNDSDLDIFVRHDFGFKATPDVLLQNEYPQPYFLDISKSANMNLKINSMGTAIGDYNGDGLLDYYVTNIRFNQLMVNQGLGNPFVEKSKEVGLGQVSISWGANFADFDNDTDLDLFVANGDLNPNVNPIADFYFENENGYFTEKAYKLGLNDYGIGRGSVVFDMDNDGDLDLLVVNQKAVQDYPVKSETRLYRNDSVQGNWIKVSLKGNESDRNGIGSRIELYVNKLKMIREVDGGSSHVSQNSMISHFGLGSTTQVDSIVIRWLGGKKQTIIKPGINKLLVIEEIRSPVKQMRYHWMIPILMFLTAFFFYIWWRKTGPV